MITRHISGHVATFRASRITTPDSRAGVSQELPLIPTEKEGRSRETIDPLRAAKTFH
jgi:hypothetical protein